uniref:Uncharacterized protein n=1 Tax=Anopheles coluzzii TaxID=1518534 RepID=A0A8W7Q3I6_ANOCL
MVGHAGRWAGGPRRRYQRRNVLILEQVLGSRWGRVAGVAGGRCSAAPGRRLAAVRWRHVQPHILGPGLGAAGPERQIVGCKIIPHPPTHDWAVYLPAGNEAIVRRGRFACRE